MSKYQRFLGGVFILVYIIIEVLSDPIFFVPPPLWTGSIVTNHLQAAIIGGLAVFIMFIVTYPLVWIWKWTKKTKENNSQEWYSLQTAQMTSTQQGSVFNQEIQANPPSFPRQPNSHSRKARTRKEIEDELDRVLTYKDYDIIGKKSVREATLPELYEFAAWDIKEAMFEGMMLGAPTNDLLAREKWLNRLERAEHGEAIFEDQITQNMSPVNEVQVQEAVGSAITDEQKTEILDFVTLLRELATLRDQGVLSEEEFQTKKDEILKRL